MVIFIAGVGPAAPGPSDEEMTFHTFRGYLAATCTWTEALYPHIEGLLPGVAEAVKAQPWSVRTPAGKGTLTRRGAEILRNAWATEVILNSPRVFGGDDLIAFANLWAPVQAYYAVFEAFTALAMTTSSSSPPKSHAALLKWASTNVGHPMTPFVTPWTARVSGAPGAYAFDGFGTVTPDPKISNLMRPTIGTSPHLLALALKTTRDAQIQDHIPSWRKNLKTKAGKPRKTLPREVLLANAAKMSPTTLFDLLWRLRVRSNYKEGDALLTGAHGPADAATFHAALSEIVAATLLTVEIYLAHLVGRPTLERCAAGLPVPTILEPHSVRARIPLW